MVWKTNAANFGLNIPSGLRVNSLHRPNSIAYSPLSVCVHLLMLHLVLSNIVKKLNVLRYELRYLNVFHFVIGKHNNSSREERKYAILRRALI
jgi:hypothetical protein